ncbi:MAG: anhydro-N-acetylmuramic acid kinase, partial [Rhodospirillaceae bacterium]|nr:anhydro-N-acetylmuramic acid kinase [Rhodospirillaceae bacterium]
MNATEQTNISSLGDKPIRLAIGLMSGTSLDGMDVAVIRSDGEKAVQFGPAATFAYDDGFRERLRSVLGSEWLGTPELEAVEDELTHLHIQAVLQFMDMYDLSVDEIDIIGFHGHTVFHDPGAQITHQIGNAQALADTIGVSVVADFRSNDVAMGGQGAPLVPVYHQALADGMVDLTPPVAVLNLGGIANVTWVGEGEGDLLAFDTGPCNALLDDWVFKKTGNTFDDDGALAKSGKANDEIIATMLSHPYFSTPGPKSLDRLDFNTDALGDLSPEDGAATLVGFIAAAVKKTQSAFPSPPSNWVLSGGGCHNGAL